MLLGRQSRSSGVSNWHFLLDSAPNMMQTLGHARRAQGTKVSPKATFRCQFFDSIWLNFSDYLFIGGPGRWDFLRTSDFAFLSSDHWGQIWLSFVPVADLVQFRRQNCTDSPRKSASSLGLLFTSLDSSVSIPSWSICLVGAIYTDR